MIVNQLSSSSGAIFNPILSKEERQAYRHIRKQVLAQYAAQLQQATGWKRYFLKWKIVLLANMRFREILLSGGWSRIIHNKTTI